MRIGRYDAARRGEGCHVLRGQYKRGFLRSLSRARGDGRLLIPLVEQGLEKLVRAALPLPEQVGEVSFDPPSRSWAAQLSRITVSMFLFGVGRSPQPPRPVPARSDANGR